MIANHARILKALSILSATAIGLSIAGPTMAARHHGKAHGPMVMRPITGLRSEGQITQVLSGNEFVITLQGGDALAVNTNGATRFVDELPAATSTNESVAPATGEYAAVTYHFAPTLGAVASQVVLSSSPVATGKPHRIDGMVTAVGNGSFTVENTNGVDFTIDLLASTQYRDVAAGAPGTTNTLAVGDFVQTWVRSGEGVNDATLVTYSNQPLGMRTQVKHGIVTAVSGQTLTLEQNNGGSLSMEVLPSASILVNGQPSSLSQIAVNDHVQIRGTRFVGVFYATSVATVQ